MRNRHRTLKLPNGQNVLFEFAIDAHTVNFNNRMMVIKGSD